SSFNLYSRIGLTVCRERLGGTTDATCRRPSRRHDVLGGLAADLALIFSRANAGGSTPTGKHALGIELDAIVNYVSADGFIASLGYGVLFPLAGLDGVRPNGNVVDAKTAQAVRAYFGVVY